MFSDASNSACGAFLENSAVSLALVAFASHLSGFKVIWYTDSQNVESIILGGSRKADLHQLALRAFKVCLKFRISLRILALGLIL